MERRTFLRSITLPAAGAVVGVPSFARLAGASTAPAGWRTFEVTTKVEVTEPKGVTRVWLPVPLMTDTDYLKRLGDNWTGNTSVTRLYRDEKYDAGILYGEWRQAEAAPVVELTSRFATRDRSLDLSKPNPAAAKESPATLKKYLEGTKLIPVDGVVLETSQEITKGATTDVEKARAIYEWIVDNTFRDPKVRGCGLGDIKTMLETRYFGGKCADLNALFVGLTRAAGIPARDVYGVRAADSKEFKSLGKSGDISKAQHCRAEFYASSYGWVPVDPADVRKVVLEEPPGNLRLADAQPQRARAKLFGQWEMNYLAFNYAHDVKLPSSSGEPIAFFMYPQGETIDGRKDSLDPGTFRYQMTARDVSA
ncbi:MAG: transglutaminase [Candidatus Rokubacteria bacterium 13_1_40CM_68_15]|nr:MAG: transglutaminase [Candidatus Rokubacteria bacterium 13_1_40CM_68_15]